MDKFDHGDCRREMDSNLVGLLKVYQDGLNNLTKEFMQASREMAEIKNDVKLLNQRIQDKIITQVSEHQKTLYGNPEDMGSAGVVNQLQTVKNDVKNIRGWFMLLWGAGVTVLSTSISFLIEKIKP